MTMLESASDAEAAMTGHEPAADVEAAMTQHESGAAAISQQYTAYGRANLECPVQTMRLSVTDLCKEVKALSVFTKNKHLDLECCVL